VYIKAGSEIADPEYGLLSELLDILDGQLEEITKKIIQSKDPESDGLTDKGEYFIGIGFTAIQQYLAETLILTGVSKSRALELGQEYSENVTYVAIINAAANWWKHEPEWFPEGPKRADSIKVSEIISEIAQSEQYCLSNVLENLSAPSKVSLCSLLPRLRAWRQSIERERNA
jgi:hypothetical protein